MYTNSLSLHSHELNNYFEGDLMNSASQRTTHNTLSDQSGHLTMNQKTMTSLIDKLVEEVRTHPYKDEVVQLMNEQITDFCKDKHVSEDTVW